MGWVVLFHQEFEPEFAALDERTQDQLLAVAEILRQFGPRAGRPTVNTLSGSKHAT
jgi:hypothetical protein